MSRTVPAADDQRRRLVEAYLEGRGERAGASEPIPRRPSGAPAPLSWAQRQVWLHAQVAPDVPLYNEPITVRRRGPLDVGALERALSEIVSRHEILRAVFAVEDGEPVQRIAPPWRWSVPVVDLRGLPAGVREAEALHLARLDAVRPFDLARGPLVRALLVHVDDDDHRLFLTLHHIVHDGVSVFGLLIPELTALYDAFVAGQRSPLAELPAPEALTATPSGKLVEPRDPVEGQLVELWEDLLGIRPIGVTDDFFDLGGHSLLAVRMLQQLAESYRVTLPLAALYANSTVERLAEALRQGDDHGFRAPMTRLNADGRQPPLIFFHGDLHGGGLYCVRLGRRLGPDQPLTVVHPLGRAGRPMPRTIEAMADEHLEALQALPRTGAWRLGGYCNGALVAFEIARRLAAAGEKVELLALIAADADTRMSSLHAVTSRLASGSDWFGRLRSFTATLEGRSLRDRMELAWSKAANLAAAPVRRARGKPTRPRRDDVYSRYFRAVMGYVPRYFPGRVVLFWPADEPCRHVDDPTHGWRAFADSVEVFTVPGDHSTIITNHIDAIAAQLATYL